MVLPCVSSVAKWVSSAVRPRGFLPAGGVDRALLRAGVAEGRRQILERGLHVLHPAAGSAPRVSKVGEEVGKGHGGHSPVQVVEGRFAHQQESIAHSGVYTTVNRAVDTV